MSTLTAPDVLPRPSARWADRLARRLLLKVLTGITEGALVVEDGDAVHRFGARGTGPEGTLTIRDPRAWSAIAFGGSVGAGRSYRDRQWTTDDLVPVIRVLARNRKALEGWRKGPARFMDLPGRLHAVRRRNSRQGSRENIAAHYDLSNDFFGLWLDETRMYSAAVFDSDRDRLADASRNKIDRLCRKLHLGPEDHLLEIGTGWGGLALHAARNTGCRVTTTTISREQHAYAVEAVKRAGLAHRVNVLFEDYRDLRGRFSRLVSVEMIEAVGERYLDGFFRKCGELLAADGLFALQAITIPDREYVRAARSVDFIKHFIFPGSCLPSLERMGRAVARETSLRLLDLEDITAHYATTLARWRERFRARARELDALGFDAAFRRLWEFYFAYCEAGFRERTIGDVQLLYAGPGYRGPVPRVR